MKRHHHSHTQKKVQAALETPKLGFVRQTLGMRGSPSLGDECGADDGAETQRDDDDGDGDDAGIAIHSISYIFWNKFVYFRSLCVSHKRATRVSTRLRG